MLIRLITCILVSAQAVKKAAKSSLFQAYALNPYPYSPYYMPYPPQMAFYPMQTPQGGIPTPNYYVQPEMPAFPIPPYGYQPMAAPQAPAPSKDYYYPTATYANVGPIAGSPMNMAGGPSPPSIARTDAQATQLAVPETYPNPGAQVNSQETKLPEQSRSEPGPIKAALSAALDEAAKEIDQLNAHTAEMTTLDKLGSQSSFKLPKISLSEESVPIDDHILNWKELIGLPNKNSVVENREPVQSDSTPLLSGKWN